MKLDQISIFTWSVLITESTCPIYGDKTYSVHRWEEGECLILFGFHL